MICPKAGEGADFELFEQGLAAVGEVEVPGRHAGAARRQGIARRGEQLVLGILGHQHLGRADAFEFLAQARVERLLVAGKFHHLEGAAGQRQPGQADREVLALVELAQGQQRALGFFRQQVGIGQGAGGDHPHHLAFHRALAGGGVADLFADGDRLAHLDQARQVLFGGVEGHARHLDRHAVGRAALGQGDAEQARGFFRILEKQFVKIAHAVKQQGSGVVRLDA